MALPIPQRQETGLSAELVYPEGMNGMENWCWYLRRIRFASLFSTVAGPKLRSSRIGHFDEDWIVKVNLDCVTRIVTSVYAVLLRQRLDEK